MTVIAAIIKDGKVYMAADSMISAGYNRYHAGFSKIVKKNDMLFGISGKANMIGGLRWGFVPPMRDNNECTEKYMFRVGEKLDKFFELEHKYRDDTKKIYIGMLIAYQGKIYEYSSNGDMLVYSGDYFTSGSGGSHAEASLFTTKDMNLEPKERLRLAIECASYYDSGCGGEIVYYDI